MTTYVRRLGLLTLMIGACVVLGRSIVRGGGLPALVALSVFGLLALLALVRAVVSWPGDDGATGPASPALSDRSGLMARWTMASFGLHLLVGMTISASVAATTYLGGDAITYDGGARAILGHWQDGLPIGDLPGGKEGYYYLLAGLYWVFGAHPVAGLVVNAALAAALVPIVSDTTYRLFGPRAALWAAPLVVLVPGMVLWTSQLMKEAPVLLLLAVAANCGVRLIDRVTGGPLLALLVTLPLLFTLRGPVGLAAVAGVVGGVALGTQRLARGAGTAMAILAGVAVVVALGHGSSGYHTSVRSDLEQVNLVRKDLAVSAKSGFARSDDVSTTAGAISYLPRGLAGIALGPFPWEIAGTRQLVALPDLVV